MTAGPGGTAAAPHVLVVDDEPSVRALLRDVLDLAGYTVTEAGSAVDALFTLESWTAGPRPALLLLDVMMPGMSGLDLLRTLRSDPRWVDVPVMLLTAHSDDDATWAGWQAGADCFLAKPFDPDQVLGWVEHLLAPDDSDAELAAH